MTTRRYNLLGQTCSKPGDHSNDDAIRLEGEGLAAVADGAGGAGIFTGEWARFLVQNLLLNPVQNAGMLTAFIKSLWEEFRNTQLEQITRPEARSKFLREGSWATLAAVWLSENKPAHWIAFGDSAVLHYRKNTGELTGYPDNLQVFERAPHLINWKGPPDPAGFNTGTFHLESDSVLILCSDAFAQSLLLQYALLFPDSTWGKDLEHIRNSPGKMGGILENLEKTATAAAFTIGIERLETILQSEEQFRSAVYAMHTAEILAQDDYSLILITPEIQV